MRKRRGVARRRRLEFDTVVFQVKKDKGRFISRLNRNLRYSEGCLRWKGSRRSNGYGRISVRKAGGAKLNIDVQRLFLILKLGTPIPMNIEAGHAPGCPNRDCVFHIMPQHYTDNMNQANGKKAEQEANDCPF